MQLGVLLDNYGESVQSENALIRQMLCERVFMSLGVRLLQFVLFAVS